MAEEFFRYVPVERERDYALNGWVTIAHIGNVRGVESVMMEWTGTGKPTDPPPRMKADEPIGMATRQRYGDDGLLDPMPAPTLPEGDLEDGG